MSERLWGILVDSFGKILLPGLTVTTGRTPTHPLGIQALADRGCEHILLDLADLLAPEIPAVTP